MPLKLARSPKNPILRPTKNIWENKSVFNCGVFEFQNSLHLLYRAQGDDQISRFGLAHLLNTTEVKERNDVPFMSPEPWNHSESAGIEDPRVTKIGNSYFIAYVSATKEKVDTNQSPTTDIEGFDVKVSVAQTLDFQNIKRRTINLSKDDTKDAAFFPEKFNNKYLMLYRVLPSLSFCSTEDLESYSDLGNIFGPREKSWDNKKVGAGAPPIKTPYGWLLFYHGMDDKNVYRLGLALLDIEFPYLVKARSEEPILEPSESYEKAGIVNNVVFTCGVAETSNEFLVYYGAADTVIGLATISKEEIYKWLKEEVK